MLPVKRYKINLVHQILNSGTDARKLETTFSKATNGCFSPFLARKKLANKIAFSHGVESPNMHASTENISGQ